MYASQSVEKQQLRRRALEQEIATLQKVLGENENADEIVSRHIKLLHQYNEAKDAAQILIGRLANHRGTTVRQIHEEYGLTDAD